MLARTKISKKIFELRTYDIKPKYLPDYIQATKDNFHLRTKHSALNGYWLTEIGGQNQVVHIWEYDSLAHRKSVRDALAADKDWMGGYVATIRKFFAKQDNVLMLPTEAELPTLKATEGPFFYSLVQGKAALDRACCPNVELCGSFVPALAGPEGEHVGLWRSNSLEDLLNVDFQRQRVNSGAAAGSVGKLLLPAPFVAHVVQDWK